MKIEIFRELYWLVGSLAFSLLATYFLFGANPLRMDESIDINIHDTYFVIGNPYAIFLLTIPFMSFIYFIRVWAYRFGNRTCNMIYLILNLFFIFILVRIHAAFTIGRQPVINENMRDPWSMLSQVVLYILMATVIAMMYTAYRSGKNMPSLPNPFQP